MIQIDKKYLFLILGHLFLGAAIYAISPLSKVYAVAMFVGGVYYIMKNRDRNNEALYVAAYIVGAEVLLRMTGGNILYEYAKYTVVVVILLGTYFSGFSKNGVPYWIFLVLLVPGVVLATQTLGPNVEMRKTISFNISGPLCLGICSLYSYRRKMTQQEIFDILLCAGLPIVSAMTYLIIFTPDLKESITSTGSNYLTSGGFGPNQVATALGLGMFVFASRVIFNSKGMFLLVINLILALNISYRGLITFSRGGMITGMMMLVALIATTYFRVNDSGKSKMKIFMVGAVAMYFLVWGYSSSQTGGLIDKRYANQDATGKVKESRFSGREELAANEIEDFLSHPVFGIGVAKGAALRAESGQGGLSHNELTRLLAEHGSFGILALIILIVTPLMLYLDNKEHIFLLPFLVFWLFTINHAAMRLAAPSFIYALALLKITSYDKEKAAVHRE
ncbi:O-antigen ligase family protein [Flavobacterium sp. MAH-1]|uniref:O-antigen ligase family protein n=1 Tax=Flavobacterium agri TaxID=2743471 RepID=A0A7Y8Y1Z7_9FLAO|nr:O-antigen ligase family protein [Flavobacterium agri]NUY80906.1 O-antigen ligase family protein [Flavobacterium agri]NYA70930.1 O-antigen ligase family protein [Flavobacterium agri]